MPSVDRDAADDASGAGGEAGAPRPSPGGPPPPAGREDPPRGQEPLLVGAEDPRFADDPLLVGDEIRVQYGGSTVLDVGRIELRSGEVLAVLGPNGAGKSTLLRTLAMLEAPTAGRVLFRGRSGRAAEKALRRASAAVFQRPHFWRDTVAYNVGLGLRLRGLPASDVEERVAEIAASLGIGGLLGQAVDTLSGGQAQRVALARALVLDPDVLFLDEPTSNLDAPSRVELRDDLERVARDRATAALLITHDRNEAFYLADRVAVLSGGRVVQTGTPAELYENPADPYIAQLTGAELALRGVVRERSGNTLRVRVEGVLLTVTGDVEPGEEAKVVYRPEDLVLSAPDLGASRLSTRNRFYATVAEVRPVAALVRIRLTGPPDVVAVVTRAAAEELDLAPGTRVAVRAKATALHAFPA